MNQSILALCLFLFLVGSCMKKDVIEIKLKDINTFEYSPKSGTHKLSVKIEGTVECPCKLTVKSNGEQTNRFFELADEVDVSRSEDWYENELGFYLDKPECAGDNTMVMVKLYR